MRPIIPLLLFILLTSTGIPAQVSELKDSGTKELKLDTTPAPTPLKFEEEKIESYKKIPEFDYSRELNPENWWTRLKRYLGLQYHKVIDWMFGDYQANSFLLFIIRLLPYLIIAGILFLGYWIFNRMNPSAILLGESETPQVFLSEDEEIIKTSDISVLIENAVARQDYRLAIRYSFLLILQQLTKRNLVDYEFSKTDEEYTMEIRIPSVQQQFRQLTRIYNYVWYGNFEITEPHYLKSKVEFEKMQELIQRSNE